MPTHMPLCRNLPEKQVAAADSLSPFRGGAAGEAGEDLVLPGLVNQACCWHLQIFELPAHRAHVGRAPKMIVSAALRPSCTFGQIALRVDGNQLAPAPAANGLGETQGGMGHYSRKWKTTAILSFGNS